MIRIFFVVLFYFVFLSHRAHSAQSEFAMPYWRFSESKNNKISKDSVYRAIASTALINSSANCVGPFVSEEGHMLTALHCLKQDLNDFDKQLKDELIYSTDPKMKNEVQAALYSTKSQTPDIYTDLYFAEPGFRDTVKVKVLAVGRGWPSQFPKAEADESVLRQLKAGIDDWALIKFDKIPEGFRCSPIELGIKASGQIVWHTGAPKYVESDLAAVKNARNKGLITGELANCFIDQFEADWKKGLRSAFDKKFPFYVSGGRLFSSYREMLKAVPGIAEEGISDAILPDFYLNSSGPSMGGYSGGGSFNESGNLIGINSMKVLRNPKNAGDEFPIEGDEKGGKNYRLTYGTSFVSIDYIHREISRLLGPEAAKAAFHCK